jgi:predicted TPR repeat methyltransferase
MAQINYTDSHKYAGKGAEYEQFHQTAWQRFLWSREKEILLGILGKYFADRDVHLLDFACGTGRITAFLENRVKTSTGVDVSGSMLAIAKEKLKRTQIIEADITVQNVLKPGKFNLITAFRFFLNAEPELRTAVLRALVEVLDEDGCFVFNNHRNWDCPWTKLVYAYHRWKKPKEMFNVMSTREMEKLVQGVGLEIIELYPIGFFHPPRVPVSVRLNRAFDNMASRFTLLNRFSESPIAVCRRRRNHSGNGSTSGK